MTIHELLRTLQRCAGAEDLDGAIKAAKQIAAIESNEAVAALIKLLIELDDVDLEDDAGDLSDEVWRTRQALRHGLEACGARAIEPLRALIARPRSDAGEYALRVLATLGDATAAPVAIEWVNQNVLAALVPLGQLAPAGAIDVLKRAIADPEPLNQGWRKRLAGKALGKINTDAALDELERLLGDDYWFARLGAVEGLLEMQGDRVRQLLERATKDADPRVAAAAKPKT